jgi:twitching motility protein PilT
MVQLAGCVQGIVAQQLLPRKDGLGRVVSTEIMIGTDAVRACIRERRTHQLNTIVQTGSQYGMTTMDKSLKELYSRGIITYETALSHAKNPQEFRNL